jgi:hypothetical protein
MTSKSILFQLNVQTLKKYPAKKNAEILWKEKEKDLNSNVFWES